MEEKPSPISVNYLYFGAFFALLAIMSASSVLVKEYFLGSRIFFLLYALGQAVLEVGAFIFLASVIRRYLGKISYWTFIGLTFVLAILHIFDFMMDRVLDLSIWSTIGFILDESFSEFLFLLDASGIPLWAWAGFFIFLAALPCIGIAIYKGTDLLASKRPILLKSELFLQMFVCIPVALFLWDCSASRIIHPDAYTALVKSLPWKFTFLEPKNVIIPIGNPIRLPTPEKEVFAAVDQTKSQIKKRPNIYLFVIESLRGDFITPGIAPNLSRFRDEHIYYPSSVSNANSTNNCWFSIFHSQFSIFWKQYKNAHWSMGSPTLNLLKKWGYKIRVYTSAQLGYYGMDELIFGKETHLIDSYQTFHHMPPVYAWQTDAKAIEALQSDLTNPELQEGQLIVVFWDATHFDYSWPKNQPARFMPFAKEIDYFKTFQSRKNIEQIKNRYRNAVHYVDSLFGNFWDHLPKRDESVVIVLGDHGEEFFEHGHLFHNSHLVDEQIKIPLYFKFGQERASQEKKIVSQMDIFPSLVDYLSGEVPSFLQGESIFRPSRWPYTMISRFNGGRTPYEFCFHNGQRKLIAQFTNKRDVFSTQSLKIRSLWNCKNDDICECNPTVESWIHSEFGEAFERLFPNKDK